MNAIFRCRMVAAELATAAVVLGACAVESGSIVQPAAAPTERAAVPRSTETLAQDPESKKESTRPPVAPVPAESRTPEKATQRAADPKAPTGALIIKPPINVMPPDTPPSDPKQ